MHTQPRVLCCYIPLFIIYLIFVNFRCQQPLCRRIQTYSSVSFGCFFFDSNTKLQLTSIHHIYIYINIPKRNAYECTPPSTLGLFCMRVEYIYLSCQRALYTETRDKHSIMYTYACMSPAFFFCSLMYFIIKIWFNFVYNLFFFYI